MKHDNITLTQLNHDVLEYLLKIQSFERDNATTADDRKLRKCLISLANQILEMIS